MTNERKASYNLLVKQVDSLIEHQSNVTAVLANVSALLKETFPERFFWVGFYLVEDNRLVLGPFQGSVACYHIDYNKGVCGTSWAEKRTLVVPNVHEFAGHIACSSLSNSEIVVPMFGQNGQVVGVLDIDSTRFDDFDEADAEGLEVIVAHIARQLKW